MRRLAQWSHDHRRRVYAIWFIVVVAAAALAGGAGGSFSSDFHLKGAESQRALDLLKQRFPQQAGDASQIVFRANTGTLRGAAQRAQVERVVRSVQGLPSVVAVQSPYAGTGAAISRDGRTAFATVAFDRTANDLKRADVERVITTARSGATSALQVNLGGQAIQQAQRPQQSAAEGIGVLVAIVVLIIVLGSVGAMTLPLIVAFSAILLATLLVTAASAVVAIADFAPQLAVMIALGVGIDYALLIINRFRGERARGEDVRAATLTSMDTAGRSVLFAGTTVVIALLGMLVLGIRFLNGPAIAAALAVLLTMVGSLTLLPALLGSWGHRIKPASLPDLDAEPRGWARLARAVERRPAAFAAGALIVLLLVASPALGMNLGFGDAGNDSPTKTTRVAYDQLSEGFGPGFNGPFLVVAELPRSGGDQAALARLGSALRAERGVAAVSPARLNPAKDTATLELFPTSKPQDQATQDLLARLRGTVVPPVARAEHLQVSIGGATATQVDLSAALSAKLPAFVLIVVGLSLLLLAVVFRSILIPLKAGFLNVLSIGAALGVITFVFQKGHLGSLIGVDSTGPIESFFPVFLFAIVFGLSMDYEVFLVTRMHEEWERTRDSHYAVRHGLALTGRVITAAAIIMISVFASFMLGDDRVIKLFGLGLASAVFFDAFVIRLFLVPSLMYLFGDASWWMPKAIDRRLPRLSIEGPERPAPAPEPSSS